MQVLKKTFDFSGTAKRSEWWAFAIASAITLWLFVILAQANVTNNFVIAIISLIFFVVGITMIVAVSCRRFDDLGWNKTLWTILLIVFVGMSGLGGVFSFGFWGFVILLGCFKGKKLEDNETENS